MPVPMARTLITAYEMHDMGMDAVLERIPDGGPYYLTIDADGLDPAIMPAVVANTRWTGLGSDEEARSWPG